MQLGYQEEPTKKQCTYWTLLHDSMLGKTVTPTDFASFVNLIKKASILNSQVMMEQKKRELQEQLKRK